MSLYGRLDCAVVSRWDVIKFSSWKYHQYYNNKNPIPSQMFYLPVWTKFVGLPIIERSIRLLRLWCRRRVGLCGWWKQHENHCTQISPVVAIFWKGTVFINNNCNLMMCMKMSQKHYAFNVYEIPNLTFELSHLVYLTFY